jgi:hypothetical protein
MWSEQIGEGEVKTRDYRGGSRVDGGWISSNLEEY